MLDYLRFPPVERYLAEHITRPWAHVRCVVLVGLTMCFGCGRAGYDPVPLNPEPVARSSHGEAVEELSCDGCRSQLPCFEATCGEDLLCHFEPRDDRCLDGEICSADGSCVTKSCSSVSEGWMFRMIVRGLENYEGKRAYLWFGADGRRLGVRQTQVVRGEAVSNIEGFPLGSYNALLFVDPEDDLRCDANTSVVFDLGRVDYLEEGTIASTVAKATLADGCDRFPVIGDNAALKTEDSSGDSSGLGGSGNAGVDCQTGGDGCINHADSACVIFSLGRCGFGIPQDVNFDGVVDGADEAAVAENAVVHGCSQ